VLDLFRLAVLRAVFLAPVLFVEAVAFVAADFFLGFAFLLGAALFALGFRRIAFFAFFAKEDTASVTAVPAVTAASFVTSRPVAATSNPAFAVSTMASLAVERTPSRSVSMCAPISSGVTTVVLKAWETQCDSVSTCQMTYPR